MARQLRSHQSNSGEWYLGKESKSAFAFAGQIVTVSF